MQVWLWQVLLHVDRQGFFVPLWRPTAYNMACICRISDVLFEGQAQLSDARQQARRDYSPGWANPLMWQLDFILEFQQQFMNLYEDGDTC